MDNFNIEDFAKMFDAALASDNPAVQKSLRNFMMIAAIVESEENATTGPFESIFHRLDALERELASLKNPYGSYPGSAFPSYPSTIPSYPSTYPGTYTGSYPGQGISGIAGIATKTPTTSSMNSVSNAVSEDEITDLISDLYADQSWTNVEVSSLEKSFKDFHGK